MEVNLKGKDGCQTMDEHGIYGYTRLSFFKDHFKHIHIQND